MGDDHALAVNGLARATRRVWVMKRAWSPALVVLAALAIGLGVDGGSGDGVRPVLAYLTGAAGSVPQVWLAGADGRRARRLGPGARPLVSPDGEIVAASSPGLSGPALMLYPTSGLAVIDTSTHGCRIVAHGPIYGASFAPGGSDRIAYASAASMALAAPVDIHIVDPDGARGQQISHDGRSLNPAWGPSAIAFDHERLRNGAAPVYQVWSMAADGTRRTQLTHVRVPPLLDGLVPIGFSADGSQLLAEYEGQDTSQAWAIMLTTGRARELQVAGGSVTGAAMSREGALALVDRGGFLNPPDQGVVEALPLTGGRAKVLVSRGSEPSWNG